MSSTVSPTVRPFEFDEALDRKPLIGIIVDAPGNLFIVDIEGNEVSLTFNDIGTDGLSATPYPYRLDMMISKVVGDGSGGIGDGSSGTNIPLVSLVGLH